jgi:hypothetical protein
MSAAKARSLLGVHSLPAAVLLWVRAVWHPDHAHLFLVHTHVQASGYVLKSEVNVCTHRWPG